MALSKYCQRFLNTLGNAERRQMLENAIERLIELGEVRYRQDDHDVDEGVFWDATGESLTEP